FWPQNAPPVQPGGTSARVWPQNAPPVPGGTSARFWRQNAPPVPRGGTSARFWPQNAPPVPGRNAARFWHRTPRRGRVRRWSAGQGLVLDAVRLVGVDAQAALAVALVV